MRRPSEKTCIGGESLSEIKRTLVNEVYRLRELNLQVTDRALEQSHLVSAYVIWILGAPEDVRTAIAREALPLYRSHLESTGPKPILERPDLFVAEIQHHAKPLGGVTIKRKRRQSQGSNNSAI